MVDPSAFAPFNLADTYGRGLQIAQAREAQQNRRRLGDLLPGAVNGDTSAMEQIAHINPELFLKLDERQKEQARAELDDVSAAVRWADTPEKWAQVQQYYGQHGHDASGYTFENRESYLLQLGKIGEYLKGNQSPNAPSDVREYEYAKSQGYTGSFMDYKNQMGSPIMVDNGDGTKTLYPRSMLNGGGQPQGGQPAQVRPQPGQVVGGFRFKGGNPNDKNSWEPAQGGPSQSGSGGFPY